MKWTQLTVSEPNVLSRSSHSLSVLGNELYLFGGEYTPRVPIDSNLHKLNLCSDSGWQWQQVCADSSPSPRVAHAQAVAQDRLFIFGGRQGITMAEAPLNDLHVFLPVAQQWHPMQGKGVAPVPRSYHQMTSVSNNLYVFGGCGRSGRLADLHVLDLSSNVWQQLPKCDLLKGRGGACFTPNHDGSKLFVVGGFIGEESNDIFSFDIRASAWTKETSLEAQFKPRSVMSYALLPSSAKLAIFGGEVNPSDKGHSGAGKFTNDTLLVDFANMTTDTYQPPSGDDCTFPCARGWAAGASWESKMVLFGGLTGDDSHPTRLNDLWVLEV